MFINDTLIIEKLKICLFHLINIGYIGCFEARNGLNAFVESINSTQCKLGEDLYSSLSSSFVCYIGGFTNFLDSDAMTIEICIDLCIHRSGFLYAGISE